MKRKIAAIFAADIAGYSRLVAEDEEETLRRLASYRAVTDDFIAKAGGRIIDLSKSVIMKAQRIDLENGGRTADVRAMRATTDESAPPEPAWKTDSPAPRPRCRPC